MDKLWEYIAIILEILSFFLVTTDLYGDERLNAIQKAIRGMKAPDGGNAIIGLVFHRTKLLSRINFITTIIVWASLFILMKNIMQGWAWFHEHRAWAMVIYLVFSLILCYPVLFTFFILLYVLLGLTANAIGFWVKVLQRRGLRKLMLPVGAILFLLSKLISILKV